MATATGRPRPPASNCDDGRTENGVRRGKGDYFGNMFAKDTVRPEKVNAYGKNVKKEEVNTFRLFPIPDPETPGEFYPARIEAEVPGAAPVNTAYIEKFMTFRGGNPGVTFICYDPDEHVGEKWEDLKWTLPAPVLTYAVARAVKENEGEVWWQGLTKRDNAKGRPPVLAYPDWMHVAYGCLYQRGEENWETAHGLDPQDGRPVLLDLGKDVGQRTKWLCDLLKEEYRDLADNGGLPDDVAINKLFEIMSPVAFKKGVFFRAYSVASKDPRVAEDRAGAKVRRWSLAEEKAREAGYTVYAAREFAGHEVDISEYSAKLWKQLRPIHSQLIFPTPEEQVEILAKHVTDPNGRPAIGLLRYAFQDREEGDLWLSAIPSEVKAVAKGKVTSLPAPKAAREAPVADEDDEDEDDAPARPLGRGGKGKADASVPSHPVDEDEDEDGEEEAKPARAPKAAAKKPAKPAKPKAPEPDDDEDEDTATSAIVSGHDMEDDDEDDEDEDDAPPAKSKTVTGNRARAKPPEPDDEDDEDDEDDDEEDEAPPAARAKPAASPPARARRGKPEPMPFAEPPAPVPAARAGGNATLAALRAAKLTKAK
jgi:hypothetical protein